jgi:Carboxypeptidase regulatory-like domain/TonB dependent receptor
MQQRHPPSNWGGTGMQMLLIFLICSLQFTGAHAQLAVTTATLSGTVMDPSGSIVPQANVTLTSRERGITRTFTTDERGYYSFSQLPPGGYSLTIQAAGFEGYEQNGIVLDAGQSSGQDVKLTLGAVAEKVVVTSQAPLLNTGNANISAEVDSKQIVELPLNMRNIINLTTLNSSVNNNAEYQSLLGGGGNTTDDADQDVSFLNFSGGFFGTTAYMLDGAWDTDPEWGAVMYVPDVDEVQEFKVQNNSFTAQYGWSTGNVVNVVTKSGSSAFHGDIYEFYRNAALDANLWFSNHNGLPKEPVTRNQTGASAGGPLYIPHLYKQRDKTFIYGVYEHFSVGSPSVGVFTVPNANFRAGNFGQLLGSQVGTDALGRPIYSGQIYNPFSARPIIAGQVDPTTGLMATSTGEIRDPIPNNNVAALGPLNPVATKLLSYYPAPTNSAFANNLTVSGNAPSASNEYSIRLDQNVSASSRFYFRYSYKQEYKTGEPSYYGATNPASPGNQTQDNRYNLAAGYSKVFGQKFTMNVSAGTQLWHEHSVPNLEGFLPSSLGLPTYLDTSPQFPSIVIGGQSNLGTGEDSLFNHGPVGSVTVDFTKVGGQHTLSFGFMGVELEDDEHVSYSTTINSAGSFTNGPNPTEPTTNTGNGVAQLLMGVADGGSAGLPTTPATSAHYFGGYLQDDWRALPGLTLNLGIRYEIQTAPTYRHNAAASFDPKALNPIGTAIGQTLPGALIFATSGDRAEYSTNYGNVAPRVGFSYQALPKLVVRGGYGIFYPPSITTMTANFSGFFPSTAITTSLNGGLNPTPGTTLSNLWPDGFIQPTGNSLGGLQQVGNGVTSNFRGRASSYVQQYMFGLQYALASNDSLEVDYYGNHGTHMVAASLNPGQLNPAYLPLGTTALNTLVTNPFYGHITGTSSCALNQPTVVQSQLLGPYPQFCNVTETNPPAGFSIYNALEATYNHRFNNGLSVLVSYTYSKFLDNVEGNQTWAYTGNSGPANNYNLAAEKSVDAGDTPHSLVASYIYDLPIGRGKKIGSGFNRKTDAVLGGWEVSGIVTSKAGIPLAVSGNNINSYGGNPRPDVIGDTHAPHQSVKEWFNTGAFAYAPYGTFGTAPRYFSTMRAPDYNNFDTGLMKNWQLREEMRIQFRAELFNTFNHPQFYSPNGSYGGCDPNSNTACVSGLGAITSAFTGREIQFGGKFYW